MENFELINELQNSINDETEMMKEAYLATEAQLVDAIGNGVVGKTVSCIKYGDGEIVAFKGNTVEDIIVDIDFSGEIKKFSLNHIMNNKFVQFVDFDEFADIWTKAFELHTTLTNLHNESERVARQLLIEAKKQAEAEKKAEAKYQKLKEKAIKDFDQLVKQANTSLSDVDEFYYALGWMAKHVGSISAALPDYLESSFTKHFGTETGARIVDSKKKTVNGNSMQWTFGFNATLRKAENIPAFLSQYLSTTGKAIANTSFIWDLVDNYGFQFGKKQDADKIKGTVPAQFIKSFEAGLTA